MFDFSAFVRVVTGSEKARIPQDVVARARVTELGIQSYVTRKHALRKIFISVKGIYYEAEIRGEPIVWLVSHNLQQTLPEDVDYRVMLTFLEFYISMTTFVNHQLYHEDNLRYPPVLDVALEDAATGAVAIVHELKRKMENAALVAQAREKATGSKENVAIEQGEKPKKRKKTLAEKLKEIAQFEDGEDEDDIAEREAAERERERENEQLRMEENIEMMTTGDEANAQMATTIMDEEQTQT